ncbi:Transcriptional regulator [Pseudomonas sp. R3-52-08]|nr:Transcriptional regulator [Pseudomonas sp. R3-52-08]
MIFRQTHSQVVAAALLDRSPDLAITAGGFAALAFLLKGSAAVATIPGHAAEAIARLTGLRVLPCPLALPRYPVELGWRTQAQLDPLLLKVREAIEVCFI